MSSKSFADLRKKSNFTALSKELEKSDKKYGNDKLWTPTKGKDGTSQATIRFLPAPAIDGDDGLPWVQLHSHSFKNEATGQWYIENCPSTIGLPCPVCDDNKVYWKQGDEGQAIAKAHKRKLSYYSNIYIVDDSGNPDNNGKVFLFRYGVQIWDKIKEAMQPTIKGETPVDVFNFYEGANFALVVSKKDKFDNYEKSKFLTPAPLLGGKDEDLEQVWNAQHSLLDLITADKFKSYADLEKQYLKVKNSTNADLAKSIEEQLERKSSKTDEKSLEKDVTEFFNSLEEEAASAPSSTVSDDDEIDFDSLLNEDE